MKVDGSRRRGIRGVVVGVLVLCGASPALADTTEIDRLTVTTDNANGDTVGAAATMDDLHIVLGAPSPIGDGGSVYTFRRTGLPPTWSQEPVLRVDTSSGFDSFGISLDLEGEQMVVGSTGFNPGGQINRGIAYVFEREVNGWSAPVLLQPSNGFGNLRFGVRVAISGDWIAVGALNFTGTGLVYLYERSGGGWVEDDILGPGDGATGDKFGTVAMDGDWLAVGASEHNSREGAVYLYELTGDSWSFDDKLTPDLSSTDAFFGVSVAMQGGVLVIGASGDDSGASNAGAAYVYELGTGEWSFVDKLTAQTPVVDDRLGLSVATDGNTVLVGAPEAIAVDTTRAGAVHVYGIDGSGWTQVDRLIQSDPSGGDGLGNGLATFGGYIAAGTPGRDAPPSDNAGAAYAYESPLNIFADGFESGNTTAWSSIVGG